MIVKMAMFYIIVRVFPSNIHIHDRNCIKCSNLKMNLSRRQISRDYKFKYFNARHNVANNIIL